MIFQGKDGELRIYDYGDDGTTYYLSVLFTEMDFTGPINRPTAEETLVMNRGKFSSAAHYIEANDESRYSALPISFSCRVADTINTNILSDWISGVSPIGYREGLSGSGVTRLFTAKGKSTIDGNTLPSFSGSGATTKLCFFLETLWDGTLDYGVKYNEIYFTPGEQTITESADGVLLSANAIVYGDVTRITGFTGSLTSII